MKKLLILMLCLASFSGTVEAQVNTVTKGIVVNSGCKLSLVQQGNNFSYYTCDYTNSKWEFIISVTITNLEADLKKFASTRDTYISGFLKRVEDDTKSEGGTITGKSSVLGQSSIQYSSLYRIETETTLKSFTSSFILGNNAYMINLMSNSQNTQLGSEFNNLLNSLKVNK